MVLSHPPLSVCLSVCSGAVLSLAMGPDGDACYSGGLDGSVRCWKIPDLNVDPYDNYGTGRTPAGCRHWVRWTLGAFSRRF